MLKTTLTEKNNEEQAKKKKCKRKRYELQNVYKT